MEVVSIIVGPIVNELYGNVSKWIREEYSGFKDLKQYLEKISSTLTTIQDVLQDAEDKQLKSRALGNWLGKLKDVALDAQDVLDMYATEASLWKKKPKVRNILYKRNAAQKIKELMERLEGVAKEKEQFDLTASLYHGLPDAQPNHPQTTYHVVEPNVVGREADKEKVIEMLLSDAEGDISVIPITGMGGLGKTTLAQLVYNDERVGDEQFKPRMWACVGGEFDLKKIIVGMIESHSKMKDTSLINLSLSILQDRLLYLLGGNRFLLVLDDVWKYDISGWEGLRNLLIAGGGKGSKILVTSRILRVSEKMGTKPPYMLDCLSETESRSLFKKIAFVDHLAPVNQEQQKELEGIGEEIVAKCRGLPLAIKAMGALLRGNTAVSKWEQILSNEIWEIEGDDLEIDHENKILPALKLSYDHLPSILKQCFAYCSIFPKSYVFVKKELVKLWMAEGFIQQIRQQRIEETGMEYFDRLLGRSFFQPSHDGKYRMHDLIHDLALSISSPLCCQLKDNEPCSQPTKARYMSILCNDAEQAALKVAKGSKKLRTLLLPSLELTNFTKTLDTIFLELEYVRSLDLSGSSTLKELPKSIEELKLLRYLDLSNTEIRVLPNSICNLHNLQTLKLLGCVWLSELPNDLSKLVNLRHLELDDMFWFKSSQFPPKMGNMTSLYNLHAFCVGLESGYRLEELQKMANLTGELRISKLENAVNSGEAALNEKRGIEKLVFEWSMNREDDPQAEASEEQVLGDLEPHSNIKELQICHYRGSTLPSWMGNELLRNLVTLTLNRCTKVKILSLGKLPHLSQLFIKGMHALEKWLEIEEMQYHSLHTLKISNCPNLKELPQMIPNLRVMKVKKCDSLKALPVTPSLQFLILLDNLVLEEWSEAVMHYTTTNDQGQSITHRLFSFLKLLELKVIGCPKLQDLPNIFAPQKLEISGCELITVLPSPEFAQRLQHMALNACQDGMLVRKIPDSSSIYSLVLSNISNLASPPKWPHLPGLKALYISGCADLESLSDQESELRSLTSLALLSVRDCPKLVTLVEEDLPISLECLIIASCSSLVTLGPKETLNNLNSLKDLHIEDCPALQSLPDDHLPASLQHLHIQGCPLLRQQWHQANNGGNPVPASHRYIPDMDIHFNQVPSIPISCTQKAPPTAWYHPLICCKALELEGDMNLENLLANAETSKSAEKQH